MLDKFIPDMYYQSIYRVNYKKLKEKGITLVIFDLDNTIATIDSKVPEKDAINLIKKVKDLGIRPILMTNSNKERTVPFRDGLEIDSCASSMKPFSKYYKKILSLYLEKYFNINDDKQTWFDKIKDLSEELGYAREVKMFKQEPEKWKAHVGDVSTVLRVSLTGRQQTPDLYEIMQVLGKESVEKRFKKIIEK